MHDVCRSRHLLNIRHDVHQYVILSIVLLLPFSQDHLGRLALMWNAMRDHLLERETKFCTLRSVSVFNCGLTQHSGVQNSYLIKCYVGMVVSGWAGLIRHRTALVRRIRNDWLHWRGELLDRWKIVNCWRRSPCPAIWRLIDWRVNTSILVQWIISIYRLEQITAVGLP